MPKILAKLDPRSKSRWWTSRRYLLATGFLALDFAIVGSLIKSAPPDWYANVVVGFLVTGYLMMVFLVIDQPDESL
jgi:hypothetical protein